MTDYSLKFPVVTVVTVVLNGENIIENTIKSVIDQSYKNIEYIVIDGGSKDKTLDVIKKYSDYISYWCSEKDSGIYNAMNKALGIANGEWIVFINSGDQFYDEKVVSSVFENNIIGDVLYGSACIDFGSYQCVMRPKDKLDFSYGLPFNHQASFVRTDVIKEIKFDESYEILADLVFFYKLNDVGAKFDRVDYLISRYRYDGVSSYFNIKQAKEIYRFYVFECKKSFLKYGSYIFIRYMYKVFKVFSPDSIVRIITKYRFK